MNTINEYDPQHQAMAAQCFRNVLAKLPSVAPEVAAVIPDEAGLRDAVGKAGADAVCREFTKYERQLAEYQTDPDMPLMFGVLRAAARHIAAEIGEQN